MWTIVVAILTTSIGRIALATIATAIGLFGIVMTAEHRGAEKQKVEQARVDVKAKAKADTARKKVRKVKAEKNDGFARD